MKIFKIGAIAVLCLFCTCPAFASGYEQQFDETWITEFGAKGYYDGSYLRGEYDSPRSSAVDSSGNLIIVGQTEGNLTGETTVQEYCGFIAKISTDGVRKWTQQCQFGTIEDGTIAYGSIVDVEVDEEDNIYVVGPYLNDSALSKLSADGQLLWTKQFGRDDASENPVAIQRGADGEIYVTGTVEPDDYNIAQGIFVTKVSASGGNVSTREYGSDGRDIPVDIGVDSQNNLYIAGYTDGDLDGQLNTGSQDIFLTKFDTTGTRLWTKLFGSETAPEHQMLSDLTRSMDITAEDVIYIAGDTQGNLGGNTNIGNYDMFVTKFSTDGEILGTILQGGANLNNPNYGSADHVRDIGVMDDGSIYLFGTTSGQLPDSDNNGNGYAQLALVKFNMDGTYEWAHQFGPCCTNKDETAVSVQKDSDNSLYLLAGVKQYYSAYYSTNFPDIAAFKLTEVNTTKFSRTAENSFDAISARGAVEQDQEIVVGGVATQATQLGTFVKEFHFDDTLSGPIQTYTAYGRTLPATNHPIAIDANNNTYTIAYSDVNPEGGVVSDYDGTVVTKYNASGVEQWAKLFTSTGGNNIPTAITASDEKVFLCGYTEGNVDGSSDNDGSDSEYGLPRVDGFIMSLNASTGEQLWVDQFSEGNTKTVFMRDLAVDKNGYLHVVGANDGSIVVNTYGLDGSIVAFEQYGSNVSTLSQMGLVIDGTDLYIVGTATGDFVPDGYSGAGDIFITKIDKSFPAIGQTVWKKQHGTDTFEEGYDIALGYDSNLYIVGFSSGDLDGINKGGTDMVIESYSPNGVLLAARQMGTEFDDKAYGILADSKGGYIVSGITNDQAIIQRYVTQEINLLENSSLVSCINEALGAKMDHSPTLDELEGLTSLTCKEAQLTSVSGIEYLSNLGFLDIEHNGVTDLTPLKDLVKLYRLNLAYNDISDISPIQDLDGLQFLDIGHNLLTDLTPLKDLVNLYYLNLAYNTISDISPIQDLDGLQYLHLTGNALTDISPLSNLINVETLTLGENMLEDISPLQSMSSVRFLHIENNEIVDISVVQDLGALESLYLGENKITDFSAIADDVDVYGTDSQDVLATSSNILLLSLPAILNGRNN